MKTKAEVMYSTMKPGKLFFVVALPSMISMFAMSIYSIIEGAFIGHQLGENAFAAVNIAMPLVMINFSLADLIGVGSSVPISIFLGKKDYESANNVFSCSLIMIFVSSVLMGLIMFFLATPLAAMMGADGELLSTSVKYLRVYALFGPFCTVFFAMDNYLRISGYVKTSMVINIGCNVLTVGLLSLFLFVFKTDIVGSAVASCISLASASLVALYPFVTKKALLKFKKPVFSGSMIKEITACGSPVFLNNIAGRVTSIVMNIALMTVGASVLGEDGGKTAVAIYAILMYASDLCWPLLYGISDSLSPAIGYNYGARDYKRVRKIASTSFIGTATVGLVSTSLLFFFPQTVASIFVDLDSVKLLELSRDAIKLFCFAYLFRWFVVSTQSFLSAIEKPLFATLLSVSMALVFPLVTLAVLWKFELDGIWLNFVGVNVLGALLGAVLLCCVMKRMKESEAKKSVSDTVSE